MDLMTKPKVARPRRPISQPSMSKSEAAQLEQLFETLANRHRVRILNMLARSDDAICVCEFQPALGLSQPSVSYHIGMLVHAGFLRREKRGRFSYYRLVPGVLEDLAWVALSGGRRSKGERGGGGIAS